MNDDNPFGKNDIEREESKQRVKELVKQGVEKTQRREKKSDSSDTAVDDPDNAQMEVNEDIEGDIEQIEEDIEVAQRVKDDFGLFRSSNADSIDVHRNDMKGGYVVTFVYRGAEDE